MDKIHIFKDDRQEQSYLCVPLGTFAISRSVFISLSDDSSDNAPMCDIYGNIDDDVFHVYSVTISQTRINITSLFSASQLEAIGDEMSKRPQIYEVI